MFSNVLNAVDILILFAAVFFLFVIAWLKGRKEENTSDFFLGSRKVPTIIACLSFVATEVSALTITGVPAASYSENWQYLQFFFGSAAAKIFVAFVFIPVFYKYNCTSVYEFLRHRFGPQTQYAGSFLFFVMRLMGSGVRLYAACAAIAWIMGWSLAMTLIIFTVVSIMFIAYGGIKAVVWTGAYQACFFYLAGAAVLIYLFAKIQPQLAAGLQASAEAGRLSVFNFGFKLNDPTTFWAGTANAFFIGLAIFGTDQELVQRLLTVRTRGSSQKAILYTIAASAPILLIYLALGTAIFIFYNQIAIAPPSQAKDIVGHFAANVLPSGLKGLILAAIVLASIDSPLASLSSSFVMDIYKPLINSKASQRHYLVVSRMGVVIFGVILAIIAFACWPVESVLWFAFQVVSVIGGSILGIFLLGVLTKRESNLANVFAMISSSVILSILLILSKNRGNFHLKNEFMQFVLQIAWSWYIVIGTILTFGLAWGLGFFERSTYQKYILLD